MKHVYSGETACELCGSRRFGLVAPADGHVILRCLACGLIFRHPKPSLDEARQFYQEQYFSSSREVTHGYENYASLAAPIRKLSRRKLHIMRQYVEPGRLLDVGAAYGLFVDEARKAGWSAEGVEISSHACRVGRRLTGRPFHEGVFEQIPLEAGAYDAVTLWDVLEHAAHIRPFVDRVAEALRPGGCAFVTLPNVKGDSAQLMGPRWFGYAKVEHIFYYSPATLRRTFEQSGLKMLGWRSFPWACTVEFVARRVAYYSRPLARALLALCRVTGLSRSEVYFHWIDLLAVFRKPAG